MEIIPETTKPSPFVFLPIYPSMMQIGTHTEHVSGKTSAAVYLTYENVYVPFVLLVLREIRSKKRFPDVYVIEGDMNSYLTVSFTIHDVRPKFVQELLTTKEPPQLAPGAPFIMLGQAKLEWNGTRGFNEEFQRQGFFHLYVFSEDEDLIWAAQLNYVNRDVPGTKE